MKYRIVKRLNPQNNAESKFYVAPQYMEELTVGDLAKDISDACTLNVTDVEAVLSRHSCENSRCTLRTGSKFSWETSAA